MTAYFSADLHLGHQRICALSGRPFSSVDEMNEKLIENWNETVAPSDCVWVLGDVCMGHIAESLPLVTRLNGVKHLISGNHDRTWAGYRTHYKASAKQKQTDWAKRYREEGGFKTVLDGSRPVKMSLRSDSGPIEVRASHFPCEGDHTADERYLDWRPLDDGGWLLHGHVHEAWKVRGRQINVGVDAWDYRPVEESTLVDLILSGE